MSTHLFALPKDQNLDVSIQIYTLTHWVPSHPLHVQKTDGLKIQCLLTLFVQVNKLTILNSKEDLLLDYLIFKYQLIVKSCLSGITDSLVWSSLKMSLKCSFYCLLNGCLEWEIAPLFPRFESFKSPLHLSSYSEALWIINH